MILGLVLALQAVASPPDGGAPAPPPSSATFDTTVTTGPSTQLRLQASAGRVTIRVWERNAVRVVATPIPGTVVRVDATQNLVHVSGSAGGRIDEAEYALTVPRRMPLTLGSGDLVIDLAGSEADVVAKNYSGRITVSRAKGALTLRSAFGEIAVERSEGRLAAEALNAPLRVTDFTGDVQAEGSANHIYLTRVDGKTVNASTVSGVIWFSGPLHADGHYTFATHSGSVFLTLVEPVNATFHVSTVSGGFASAFPATREEGPRRGRFTARIGNGAASVDVETFNGGIVLRRPDPSAKGP